MLKLTETQNCLRCENPGGRMGSTYWQIYVSTSLLDPIIRLGSSFTKL